MNERITAYNLSCGKVYELKTNFAKTELYKEHNVYHVRRFSKYIDGRWIQDAWFIFERLDNAKKCFSRQKDLMKAVQS